MNTLQKGPKLQEGQSLQEKIRNNPVATKATALFAALSILMASPTLESCSKDSEETPDVISPTITIINNKNEIDITGGKTFSRSQNKLFMDNEEIVNRKDNITTNCKADIKYTNSDLSETKEINGNVFIINPGTITITIEDDAGNITSKKINLTSQNSEEELITGLENLYKLNITVDEPVNLLEGVNIKNGLEPKVSIEIDGVTTQINNPYNYTFALPCTFNEIITLEGEVYLIPNLSVKPIEYNEPTIITADILKDFPFYSVLKNQKEFLYPHIQISMSVNGICEEPISIMFGETVEGHELSDNTTLTPLPHAAEGFKRICDYKGIEYTYTFSDKLQKLREKLDPNKFYIISSAVNIIRHDYTKEQFSQDSTVIALKNLLNQPNVILITAAGDRFPDGNGNYYYMTLNENENDKPYSVRNMSGVNSKNYDNMITIIGYNPKDPNKNCFSQNGPNGSLRPIGYSYENGNVVMYSTGGVSISNKEDPSTDSSFPTDMMNGLISNMIAKIKSNYPWINNADLSRYNSQNYYIKEGKLKDKDENGNIVESNDYGYIIDSQKFINNELLHKPEIENTQFNTNIIKLPSYAGTGYVGKGIMFKYNGILYEASKENQSYYTYALKGKDTERFLNITQFRKEGGGDFTDFSVFAINKNGEMIPDTEQECNYSISTSKYQASYDIFGTGNNFYNPNSTQNNYHNPIYNTNISGNNFYNINRNQSKLKP